MGAVALAGGPIFDAECETALPYRGLNGKNGCGMTLCILHIGSEKTGTSSIQKYFGDHREALLKEGFWYPRSFANTGGNVHLKLSGAALSGTLTNDPAATGEFRSEYEKAIKAGIRTTVFSSEFFHSQMRDPAAVARLREFLAPFFDRFLVVYYARRQDHLLASMHSTAVRGAWTTNRAALPVYDSKGHHYFDHLAVCDLWSGLFGLENMACRVYERDRLVNGDIVDDFSAVIGLGIDEDRERVSSNESLSLETMSALLLLNGSRHKDNEDLRRKLIASGKKRDGRRVPMLTKAEARTFMARFDESNRAFFRKYIDPALATGFSGDFASFPETVPELSAQEILDFIFARKR